MTPDEYPVDGTIEDVKDWVGDDPDRARAAVAAEADGKSRKTLLTWLSGVAEPQTEPGEPEPGEPEGEAEASETPVYVATKRLRYEGDWLEVGDEVPGAHAWPRLESWVRQRYVKQVSP
jgi:hypothetical protein